MSQADTTAPATRLAVLLFTDIVDSTQLKSKLGTAAYARMLARHNELFESSVRGFRGAEILKHTGDGYFAAFATASDAVRFAIQFQLRMQSEPWDGRPLRTRVGVHIGEVALLDMAGRSDVVGLSADMAARIMSMAAGGQILMTASAFNDARQFVGRASDAADAAAPLRWIAHGLYQFKGCDDPLEVFEVGVEGVNPLSRPADSDKARRVVPHDQEPALGWRPAVALEIPGRPGWVLERKLGDGGFGEVWLGIHRQLKDHRVFKFCFDVDRVRSFKRELTLFRVIRESLGDREDIARLYEVRLDEPPFFLESEFIEGGNLSDWAASRGGIGKIPLEHRLDLLARVSAAVAAAHIVGVLHKDIKPANILMRQSQDGTVTPVLADFGIGALSHRAGAADGAITKAGFTAMATRDDLSRFGTQIYTPPESLLSRPFTTQGDVYALGVLMYQMVAGDLSRPFAPGWEREVPDELLREDIAAMVEGDPQRRLLAAFEVTQRILSLDQRRSERVELRRADLAREQRRRWKRLAALAGVFAAALLVVVGVAGNLHWQRLRAEQAKTLAALREAQAEQELADRTRDFLVECFRMHEQAPDRMREMPVGRAMDRALDRLADGELSRQPEVEASVQLAIASILSGIAQNDRALGLARDALATFKRVHPGDHPRTARALTTLASVHRGFNQLDQAGPLLDAALEMYRRLNIIDQPEVAWTLANRAGYYSAARDWPQAESHYRQALEILERIYRDSPHNGDHPRIVVTLRWYADTCQAQGQLGRADALRMRALRMASRLRQRQNSPPVTAFTAPP